MRIIVLGDTHIPRRASNIPKNIKAMIEKNKPWDLVIFTGDLTTPRLFSWLNMIGKDLKIVRGNMDYLDLPDYEISKAGMLRLGIVHGDQVYPRGDIPGLSRLARRLGVDVMFSGHTHYAFVKYDLESKILHINPGSLTGVWGGGGGSLKPSFATVSVEGKFVQVCVYEFEGYNAFRRCEEYEL